MTETTAKSSLATNVGEEFARYFEHLAGRVEKAVRAVHAECHL